MIDRFVTGLRNQGPGAIPALALSLLALGATAFWLLSQNDDEGTPAQPSEVVSAPSPIAPATTPDETVPPAPAGSDSGDSNRSAGGDSQGSSGVGGDGGGSTTPPVAPAPSDSGTGSDAATPADEGGSSNGDGGSGGDDRRTLEDVQQLLLNGNRNPDRHHDSGRGLPGVENLLGNGSDSGSGSSNGGGSAPTVEDLLDQLNDQK
jgi:hypothetical protein